MGYYEEYNGVEESALVSPPKSLPKKNKSSFLMGLLGVLIGSLITGTFFWGLFLSDYFKSNDSKNTQNSIGSGSGVSQVADKSVSIDVNSAITSAADKAIKSVVGISNLKNSRFGSSGLGAEVESGTGSGVIYKISGDKAYIVTNNHVVDGANSLEVTLPSGDKEEAILLGTDELLDIAVISISSKGVTEESIAEFGDSSTLKIAEPVIAIGNPLGLQFSGSVTQGIVSGLNRTVPVYDSQGNESWNADVIQTDAAINPGNSGGALVNSLGQTIGINSMKISQSAVEGIGFAIPINTAKPIIEQLETNGKVTRPYLGINLVSVNGLSSYNQQKELKLPEDIKFGVAIVDLQESSPAYIGGLRKYDVVIEMDGEKIEDVAGFKKVLYTKGSPEQEITIKYYRNGNLETTNVKPGVYNQ